MLQLQGKHLINQCFFFVLTLSRQAVPARYEEFVATSCFQHLGQRLQSKFLNFLSEAKGVMLWVRHIGVKHFSIQICKREYFIKYTTDLHLQGSLG